MKDRANVYALLVAAGAVAVLWLSSGTFLAALKLDPRGIATLFTLLAVAGVLTYVTLRGGGAVTGTAVVNFAVVITYGGEVASWLAAIEMLVLTLVLLRFSFVRSIFNASQMAISLGLAGIVYEASGGVSLLVSGGRLASGLSSIPPLVLCHLAYFASNTCMVAVWTALKQKRPAVATWKASYLWTLPQSFGAPVVGLAVAYLFVRGSVWLLGILFLWLVYYARTSKTNLELANSQRETVAALASIVDSSTPFLGGESERVAGLALELGRRLGLAGKGLGALECAALVHDVGYIAVGNRILSKGESLAPDEWAAVVRHAETGASIVGKMRGLEEAARIVLAHHERPDGRGYPRGLAARQIPKAANILKVADAFVAMTTDRPYRKAMAAPEAVECIRRRAGSQFDNAATRALVALERAGGIYQYAAPERARAA
jgi:HD-GYP domain-containing protein (c-di-GMP phosphodiesterase class II)